VVGVAVILLVLLGALAALLGSSAEPWDAARLLSPGLWVPLGVLAAAVAAVVAVRRHLARCDLRLQGSGLQHVPGLLTRVLQGEATRSVELPEARALRLLETREGTWLALFGADAGRAPLLAPLARTDLARLLDAVETAPAAAWDPRARAAVDALRAHGEAVLMERPSRLEARDRAATYRAAGLWHLAAEALWPEVLARPAALEPALELHAGERLRLSSLKRLGLLGALLAHHDRSPVLLADYARLCLVLRNRPEAAAALDRLVALPDPPAVGQRWRQVLREKRPLPAPPSKATFGIEVALPSHRLDGAELVVNDRWRVGLDWFVAYRLLPGFWGPPRRLQLIDLWGARHVMLGDPLAWAARLERAAPHLCEVHDEGLLPPGTGARIRQLRRLGPSP
jgi:hypothetical protein